MTPEAIERARLLRTAERFAELIVALNVLFFTLWPSPFKAACITVSVALCMYLSWRQENLG